MLLICTSYATLSNGIPWNIARVTYIFLVYTRAIEITVAKHDQCDIYTALDGKVGWNTVEYTTAFLHSDWLYCNQHI